MKNYCFIKKKGISLALGLLLLGGASIFAANQVNLSVGIFKPVPSIPGHGKSPILIPSVWQDGYELSFPSSHVEYTLNLLLDGGVAYSVIVAEDAVSVTLPSWLEGDYEIQLHTGGSYYFFGDITL